MPELPEVETTLRGIKPYTDGQIITHITVRQSCLRYFIPQKIIDLQNQPVLSVIRRAKYLLFELPIGWIVIHLGMTGHLRIFTQYRPAQKHDHFDVHLDNGAIIRYTDQRRFGFCLWNEDGFNHSLLKNLGPEPLSDEFNLEYLIDCARQRKLAVKSWIMDNKTVVGVGNIYASESLFRASILPERAVSSLTRQELSCLIDSIRQVIIAAIEQGGTTIKDFLNAEGRPGYFVQQLCVYGRKGLPCLRCAHEIQAKRIGQRNTFYCQHCQK